MHKKKTFLLYFIIFINIFLIGISQDTSNDTWSHAFRGRIIWTENRFPDFSDYSCVPNQNTKYKMNFYSIYQIFFYFLISSFGYSGIIIFKIAVFLIIYIFLLKICKLTKSNEVIVSTFFLLFIIGAYNIVLARGDVFNLLLWPICIYFLEYYLKENTKKIYLLIPLQILWCNLHQLCIAGPLLITIYGLFCFSRKNYKQAKLLFSLGILTFIVSGINLSGYRTIFSPFYVSFNSEYKFVSQVVLEFNSLAKGYTHSIVCYAIVVIISIPLLYITAKNNWHHFVTYISLTIATFLFYRLIGIFFIFSSIMLFISIGKKEKEFPFLKSKKFLYIVITCYVIFSISIFSNIWFKINNQLKRCTPTISNIITPHKAVSFLKKSQFSGNVFNDYETGGYIGYYLYPKIKIIDLSLALVAYTLEHFKFTYNISLGKINHNEAVKKYNVSLFILQHHNKNQKLIRNLHNDSKWRIVYLDEGTVIFADRNEKTKKLKSLLSKGLIDILHSLKEERALMITGTFFVNIRDFLKAKKFFSKVIKINPKHGLAYNNLGVIAAKNKKYEQALKYYLKSARYSSNKTLAKKNIAKLFRSGKIKIEEKNPLHIEAGKLFQ